MNIWNAAPSPGDDHGKQVLRAGRPALAAQAAALGSCGHESLDTAVPATRTA